MQKRKRLFTKSSSSGLARRRDSLPDRARSSSEVLESSKQPQLQEFLLNYLGYSWADEPRSARDCQQVIRHVLSNNLPQRPVSLSYAKEALIVRELSGVKLLESPLSYIALVSPEEGKGSCLSVSLCRGHNINQAHVFQATNSRQASDVIAAIQKACRKSRKPSERPAEPRVLMEDEDELLEFKKTPSNKKTLSRVSSEILSTASLSSPTSASTGSFNSLSGGWRGGKKAVRTSDSVFSREEKVYQLATAASKICENNSTLRERASKTQNPAGPFQDALYAMSSGNRELLTNYLSCGHVGPDSSDSGGNTLLHYAVALGQLEAVRIIAREGGLDTPGWNECHVLHRAVAEGNMSVLQHLLRKGASPNALDIMRRTPLHISCAKMEFVECSIALLEYGAQISASDVLGLRPCDTNPDLKEIQNRLINSACDSFVSSQVRDSGVVATPTDTPLSSSPSRPSSINSVRSHDLWTTSHDSVTNSEDLDRLVDNVSSKARALRAIYGEAGIHGSQKKVGGSHGSLSELLERDEDEYSMRERFKFPSSELLARGAWQVAEEGARTLTTLDQLKTAARRIKNSRGVSVELEDLPSNSESSQLSLDFLKLQHELDIGKTMPRPSVPHPLDVSLSPGDDLSTLDTIISDMKSFSEELDSPLMPTLRRGKPLSSARGQRMPGGVAKPTKPFLRKTSMPEIPVKDSVYKQIDHVISHEPMNTALKLMVTLSSNPECSGTLISHICLPKCESKLVALAKDSGTSPNMLTDIASLLQNLFATGSQARKNALNSGVLDLTIKLLGGRDPLPGTCLSLLNSLLLSEDDTDYLRTIIRIPTEPLLLYLEPPAPQALSPTLGGPAVTGSEARSIVLKMLAVASSHLKMQSSLSNERALGLLAQAMEDESLSNVTNSVMTMANIAQHTGSHELILKLGLVDKLNSLLNSDSRTCYHAARALVYLGQHSLLGSFSLFQPTATGYGTDVVVSSVDEDGHSYARAATIEKCVEFISGDSSQLWGGVSLLSSRANQEALLTFFLTTYKSFVRPIVLMNLLLHRLAHSQDPNNPFDWSLSDGHTPHSPQHIISSMQSAVLTLIGRWLELFPDDFTTVPELQNEVERIVRRLKASRGPFIPHSHRLRSLLADLARPKTASPSPGQERSPHHNNLYTLCKQMVVGGHLPVTMDEAIFLSSLQLHIEEATTPANTTPTKSKKGFTLRLKGALPPGLTKSKPLLKRIRTQIESFHGLSERNSKHLYIERCHNNPGYDATFFSVKVPSSGRFKRGGVTRQLLGVGNRGLVILDDKTKELLTSHPLNSVLSVSRDGDSLVLHMRGDSLKLFPESTSAAREITNILEAARDGLVGEALERWSDSTHQLVNESDLDDLSCSTPSSSRGATPPLLSSELPFTNGKSDTLRAVAQDDALVSDLPGEGGGVSNTGGLYCDCPPDPLLGPQLSSLSLSQVLQCPLEVARQMSLIAQEHFSRVSSEELLRKVHLIPRRGEEGGTAIKRLAHRFNQVGNWVAHSVLQYDNLDERVDAIQSFIRIAQHCLELGNTSSVMAIVVAGLGSSPIRRLAASWELVSKTDLEQFKHMDSLLEEKNNYKAYRELLSGTALPAVPYIGVFLKDLTFIADGNPDYLRGGLINLHKRRQVYKILEEIAHFQTESYRLHKVVVLENHLLAHSLVPADDLHSLSLTVEPRMTRSSSTHGARSLSTGQKSFFKLTRTSSASASNLHKT